MNAKNEALRVKCVEHWKRMRDEENPRTATEFPTDAYCDFCKNYIDRDCAGCPIMEKTGLMCCSATPYMAAFRAWGDWKRAVEQVTHNDPDPALFRRAQSAQEYWQYASQEMIDFLNGL